MLIQFYGKVIGIQVFHPYEVEVTFGDYAEVVI